VTFVFYFHRHHRDTTHVSQEQAGQKGFDHFPVGWGEGEALGDKNITENL